MMLVEIIWGSIGKIVAAAGGMGLLILGISKYIGDLFANRYVEKIKTSFQKEISSYENKLEILKQATIRYSDTQFNHYNKLWISLVDLKIDGQMLWDQATFQTLKKFTKQLRATKIEVEKSAIFLEDNHFDELMEVLEYFSQYEVGKNRLIDLREEGAIDQHQVNQVILDNGETKEKYERLVKQIRFDLRRQLKG